MKSNFFSICMLACSSICFVGCGDDALPEVDNTVNFEAAELGFSPSDGATVFNLALDRVAAEDVSVTVSLAATDIVYGEGFTTQPSASNNSLTATIKAGETSAAITVTKAAGLLLEGNANIDFAIANVTAPGVKGAVNALHLAFADIVSQGSALTLNGLEGSAGEAGSSARLSVFVDFSSNKATGVARTSWDLGFYCGADFRVIINNTAGATAKALEKTDLAAVVAADTVDLVNVLKLGFGQGTFDVIDDVEGDLSKTVIAAISPTAANNKVYIVNPGSGRWKKIRVLQNNGGYSLQYANITDTEFKTVQIAKNADNNFRYVSLVTGAEVTVEPAKAKWDIEWTYSTFRANATTPYLYADFVYTNTYGGAKSVQVITEEAGVTYENFAASHLSALTLSASRVAIGSEWRVTTGTGVRRDRFYVVQDPSGNVYKLRFEAMGVGNDGGVRGKPEIEYALVKAAE
jgi:hypothetical protein